MSNTETLERARHETGLSDSTHSSTSSSAERYRLDEFDGSPILLYKYRGGLQTSSQKDLCSWLDKDANYRVTRKPLPRFTSYLNIKRHDLYLPSEHDLYSAFPNYNSDLASVKIPSIPYWSRLLLGGYQDLYIVSPESSPASSQADEESRRTSPTGTWGADSWESVDARLGAVKERQEEERRDEDEQEDTKK